MHGLMRAWCPWMWFWHTACTTWDWHLKLSLAACLPFPFEAQASSLPDLRRDYSVRESVEGWAKAAGMSHDMRMPVSPGMLQRLVGILPVVCSSTFNVYSSLPNLHFCGA